MNAVAPHATALSVCAHAGLPHPAAAAIDGVHVTVGPGARMVPSRVATGGWFEICSHPVVDGPNRYCQTSRPPPSIAKTPRLSLARATSPTAVGSDSASRDGFRPCPCRRTPASHGRSPPSWRWSPAGRANQTSRLAQRHGVDSRCRICRRACRQPLSGSRTFSSGEYRRPRFRPISGVFSALILAPYIWSRSVRLRQESYSTY